MHIMEGFLPPVWCAVWYAVAIPAVLYGSYRTAGHLRDHPRGKALVAVAAAFVFVLSALKLPSVTGSTSHPAGTGVAVVLFGPAVTAVLSTLALVYQSLFLAHGGLTTLGANVTSMGIVGPLVGWGIFRLTRRRGSLPQAAFAAAVVADWTTYVVTSLQLAVAFPSHAGLSGVVTAAANFLGIFAITQVPIGIIEGLLAAALISYLQTHTDTLDHRLGVTA